MGGNRTRAPRVSLRPTTAADLTAVTAWERHPDNAAYVEVWPYGRHLAALTDPAMRHFVVECDGSPVGFVILAGLGGARPVVEFRRIVVAEKGSGIGQAIALYALEVGTVPGATSVQDVAMPAGDVRWDCGA